MRFVRQKKHHEGALVGVGGFNIVYGSSTGSLAITGQGAGRHALRSVAGDGCHRPPA